jgi:hypothetical protein
VQILDLIRNCRVSFGGVGFMKRRARLFLMAGLSLACLTTTSVALASTVISYGDGSNSVDSSRGLLGLDVNWGASNNDVSIRLGIGGDIGGHQYTFADEVETFSLGSDIAVPVLAQGGSTLSAYNRDQVTPLPNPLMFIAAGIGAIGLAVGRKRSRTFLKSI